MVEETQGAKNLFSKIAAIKGNVKRLKKTGRNNFQNYDFATNGDVYDLIREQLAEQNVALFAEVVSWEAIAQAKGYHVILQMRFTFACGDTGQTFSCLWAGESADSGDKGFNKAMTAGTKYFLLSTFLISTGEATEDADSQSPDVSGKSAKAPAKTAPTTPKVVDKPQGSPQAWNKQEMTQFWSWWNGEKQFNQTEILGALNVEKLSDWQGTIEQANKRMEPLKKAAGE